MLGAAAYHGLAGEVVATLLPQTEADPVALLLQYLVYFGNAVGRGPYYQVENDKHFANLFLLLAGNTAKARKGLSAGRIRHIFDTADPDWARECITGGMSSGEGVLHAIRDPVYAMQKGVSVMTDPGVEDKRLLLDEREFYSALEVMKREGNILIAHRPRRLGLPAGAANADQEHPHPRQQRLHLDRRPHHDRGAAAEARPHLDGERLRQPVYLRLRPPQQDAAVRRRRAGRDRPGNADQGRDRDRPQFRAREHDRGRDGAVGCGLSAAVAARCRACWAR